MIKLKELVLTEDEATENELKSILKQDYKTFVDKLGKNIKDPKFVAAIKSFSDEHPIKTRDLDADVDVLKPTQSEVVLTKSLKYPLTRVESAEKYLRGGTVTVGAGPIITAGGGRYVIDGHHRWSQLFCINPTAKIKALDIVNITDPFDALKATQVGVAAQLNNVPKAPGGGINLFQITRGVLVKYVIRTMTSEVLGVFKKYGKGRTREEVADYIWKNVQLLQSKSKPVIGAPKREIMPQTDDAPAFKDTAINVGNIGENDSIKLKELSKFAEKQMKRKKRFALTSVN